MATAVPMDTVDIRNNREAKKIRVRCGRRGVGRNESIDVQQRVPSSSTIMTFLDRLGLRTRPERDERTNRPHRLIACVRSYPRTGTYTASTGLRVRLISTTIFVPVSLYSGVNVHVAVLSPRVVGPSALLPARVTTKTTPGSIVHQGSTTPVLAPMSPPGCARSTASVTWTCRPSLVFS